MARILVAGNTAGILARFRMPILKAARAAGHEVICLCGNGMNAEEYFAVLEDNGFTVHRLPGLEQAGLSPRALISQARALRAMIGEIRPDILHSFTHRANIVSWLGLRGNKDIRFIPNVTGAGRLFLDELSLRDRLAQAAMLFLYKRLAKRCECIFFQNADDLKEIGGPMGLPPEKLKLTNGSGLDPREVVATRKSDAATMRRRLHEEFGVDPEKRMYLLPSRALKSKGVVEFYKAAELYLDLYDDAVFVNAGEAVEGSAEGLSEASLKAMQRPGLHFVGFQSDIYSLMEASDVVVLPSFYREGVPRALIEALGFGKMIITSDRAGCRETVIDGWNGSLVTMQTPRHVLSAMIACREMDASRASENSRLLFERCFHADRITEVYLEQYRPAAKTGAA